MPTKETHDPIVIEREPNSARYAFRNWSHAYKCPKCGHEGRFNKNFLGRRKVVCQGGKFTRENW